MHIQKDHFEVDGGKNTMLKQITHTILMIEPVSFGFNQQTAVNNFFQQKDDNIQSHIQELALAEFNDMVKILRANDVDVLIVKDTLQPHTPDAIFPNNWISFHEGGQVVLYPMFAENRRKERRDDIIQFVSKQKSNVKNIDDFSFWEEQNLFLEGTGSMIFDRVNRYAFAALSERTEKSVFLQFCKVFEFKPVYFSANQSLDGKRLAIYHTNVMMSLAENYAVICLESIDNLEERKLVVDALTQTNKEIIPISEDQMHHFAGNMLQIENRKAERLLVLSQSAYDSLNKQQIDKLTAYNKLIVISIPTIERVGGGSVRCMMAEVF